MKTTLGIGFALMTTALIVGATFAYSSANASVVTGTNGGTAGNGQNGGYLHGNVTMPLNGAPGKDANGLSQSADK